MGVRLTSTFTGGFMSDVDATIVSAKYANWEYPGSAVGPVPAALITWKMDGVDEPREESYTLGGTPDNWSISKDGKTVDSLRAKPGREAGFSGKSKWGIFLNCLIEALKNQKMSSDWITDDITCLVGLNAHVVQFPTGGKSPDGVDRKEPVVDTINSLPGKSGAASSSAVGGLATDKAVELITSIIIESGDSGVAKSSLGGKLFMMMKSDPAKNDVAKLAGNEAFLKEHFELNGGILKLKA